MYVQHVLAVYTRELALRTVLVEQLVDCADRDQQLLCLTAWLHQPMLDAETVDAFTVFRRLSGIA